MPRRSADDSDDRLETFIEAGADIAGSATSTAVGILIDGSSGAMVGAAAGPVLSHAFRSVAGDFVQRYLSTRERARASGVLALAIAKVDERMRLGYELRHDDFFFATPGNRSMAEEIAEGVLIAAQRENQEAKIPFLAHLLANTAFRHDIDRATANRLIELAKTLSYRQFCLLANVVNGLPAPTGGRLRFRIISGRALEQKESVSPVVLTALDELADLETRGLVDAVTSISTDIPSNSGPHTTGLLLYEMLGLSAVDENDLHAITELLNPPEQGDND